MNSEHEEAYVLGDDVTRAAAAKGNAGTTVLSVRVPIGDLADVESICRADGKTLSQVVREAIRRYVETARRAAQPTVTISFQDGVTVSTGHPSQVSMPTRELQRA